MAKLLKNQLSLATDGECAERRRALIASGTITPNTGGVIIRENRQPVISTKRAALEYREQLINQEFISPELVEIPEKPYKRPLRLEEGEYHPRPIQSDADYHRKRQIYFRMLQEILHSRKNLKLMLGKKKESDPDWYF